MLYPFMTLNDGTEIVHSESYYVGDKEHVRVEIERPVEGGFYSAVCVLPQYEWQEVEGFSKEEIEQFNELIKSLAHVIFELARDGGFDNASSF